MLPTDIMVSTFNKASVLLLAGALFTTFASQASVRADSPFDLASAPSPLSWECVYEDNEWKPEISILDFQWFLINVELARCAEGCAASIKKADVSDADAKETAQALCSLDRERNNLITLRGALLSLRTDFDIVDPPPNDVSQQVLNQDKECTDARAACSKNAQLYFKDKKNLSAQKVCVDQCGVAASACNALVNRGDDFEPWRKDYEGDLIEDLEDFEAAVLASRKLANKCSAEAM